MRLESDFGEMRGRVLPVRADELAQRAEQARLRHAVAVDAVEVASAQASCR